MNDRPATTRQDSGAGEPATGRSADVPAPPPADSGGGQPPTGAAGDRPSTDAGEGPAAVGDDVRTGPEVSDRPEAGTTEPSD